MRTDRAHHLAQCRCGIWFHTLMDDPTFPPHTATAEWVTFGTDAAQRSDVLHGHARTTTEHEVASPSDARQPASPPEQTDLQGEPATSPRPTTPVADEPPFISVWINAPVCDDCWTEREGDRVPARWREPETEACHYCGRDTRSGIYQRTATTRG